MKITVWIAIIALGLLQAASQNSGVVIRGSVTNQATSEPLAGAQIKLNILLDNPRASAPLVTVTDEKGNFEIPNVPAGRYVLSATRAGFVEPPSGEKPSNPTISLAVNIVAGQRSPEIKMEMIRGGAISGTVTDPDGIPVSGVSVFPYQLRYHDGHPTFLTSGSVRTDERGQYRIGELASDDYFIGAVAPLQSPDVSPGKSWIRTFYPGTTDPAAAKAIKVTEAIERKSIDLGIQFVKTFSIRGRVVNSLPQVIVRTFSSGEADTSVQAFALAARDVNFYEGTPPQTSNFVTAEAARRNGEFEIRAIPPGLYDLFPIANVILNGEERFGSGRIPVEVRTADVAGVALAIGPGAELRGKVRFKNSGNAVPTELLRVVLHPLDNIPLPLTAGVRPQPVSGSGTFTFQNVPEAVYSLFLNPMPANAFISDIQIGKKSVFDSGIVVGKEPLGPIELTVDMTGRRVAGVVFNANGKPAANAIVVLVPAPQRRQNAELYHSVVSEMNGQFVMTGVAPGEYKLFAWEKVLSTAWQNAEFLSPVEAKGLDVVVKVKSVFGLQVQVIPGK